MHTNKKYALPDNFDKKQFLDELSKHYTIRTAPVKSEIITFYDTFDWRLFNKSLILYNSGKRLFLRKLAKDEIILNADISTTPIFIWDFPEGELKQHLKPILKMRALLKLVELRTRSMLYRILDQNEKTVAGLTYEEIRPSRTNKASTLEKNWRLRPVKGYPKYERKLSDHLQAKGFRVNKKEDVFYKALESAGKRPGSYSAKVNIKLNPGMRSDEATKVVLQFLLDVMKINAAIMEKDFDTEILHDFRVAIRRTRSALGQVKSIFPVRTTNRFKNDFAAVGKLSNELRDLDVYLLKEAHYKAMLPAVLRGDIVPLFYHLRKKRSKALSQVIRGLRSKNFVKIMQDWEAFLKKPVRNSISAGNAGLPVIDLACERIYKKYRAIVKAGNMILQKTEDEKLHALRIECKKLRYLMEFFASLYSPKKISALIEQLKKLQDNLGDFNDLCIQVEYLLDIAQELPATTRRSKNTLVSIGSLIGTLDRERKKVKGAFAKTFTGFASIENQALFRELFAKTT